MVLSNTARLVSPAVYSRMYLVMGPFCFSQSSAFHVMNRNVAPIEETMGTLVGACGTVKKNRKQGTPHVSTQHTFSMKTILQLNRQYNQQYRTNDDKGIVAKPIRNDTFLSKFL